MTSEIFLTSFTDAFGMEGGNGVERGDLHTCEDCSLPAPGEDSMRIPRVRANFSLAQRLHLG